MPISWPGTLPQTPTTGGYEEAPPDLTIRTEMDAGQAKRRRRFTAGPREFSVSFVLTKAQVATLDTFYVTTLKGGSLSFDWFHPRTGAAGEFAFVGRPNYRESDGGWEAGMKLEQLP